MPNEPNPTPEELAAWREIYDPKDCVTEPQRSYCAVIARLIDALETSEAKVRDLQQYVEVVALDRNDAVAWRRDQQILKETK